VSEGPYAVEREAIFVSDEEGVSVFSKNGRSLIRVLFKHDKNTIGDIPEGEFVNPVHSSYLKSFVDEGEGFESY
jgi:hypothetical protein